MRKAALANPELCYCGPHDGGLVDPLGGRGGPWTTVETVKQSLRRRNGLVELSSPVAPPLTESQRRPGGPLRGPVDPFDC